jgi:hypothetical protein
MYGAANSAARPLFGKKTSANAFTGAPAPWLFSLEDVANLKDDRNAYSVPISLVANQFSKYFHPGTVLAAIKYKEILCAQSKNSYRF